MAVRVIQNNEIERFFYGPNAWNAVSGTAWGGTDDDLTGPDHNDDPPSDEGFTFN